MIKLFKKIRNNLKIRWQSYVRFKFIKFQYEIYVEQHFRNNKWEDQNHYLYNGILSFNRICFESKEYMQIETKEIAFDKFNNKNYNVCVPLKFKNTEERIKYMKIIEDLLFEENKFLDK